MRTRYDDDHANAIATTTTKNGERNMPREGPWVCVAQSKAKGFGFFFVSFLQQNH